MLSTARSSCVRTLAASRPAWSLSLPAESSRQAAIRASVRPAAPRLGRAVHAKHTSPYSAMATATAEPSEELEPGHLDQAEQAHEISEELEPPAEPLSPGDRTGTFGIRSPGPKPSFQGVQTQDGTFRDEAPAWVEKLPPLARVHCTINTHPRLALSYITDLSPTDMDSLTLADLDLLLWRLSQSLGTYKVDDVIIPAGPEEDTHRALVRINAALLARHATTADMTDRERGEEGKRVSRLLRMCVRFGADSLFRTVWKARLQLAHQQVRERERREDGDGVVTARIPAEYAFAKIADVVQSLTIARKWDLAKWLLQPRHMPWPWYNYQCLDLQMTASLANGDPSRVPSLYGMYEELGLKRTEISYCCLIQAHLTMGEVDYARAAMAQGKNEIGLTSERIEYAILRGHKPLGGARRIAERVLEDCRQLGVEPSYRLLNILIDSQIDDFEYEFALELLDRFTFAGGKVEPSLDTYAQLLRAHSSVSTIQHLHQIWDRLLAAGIGLNSQHVAVVVGALCHDGQVDEAFRLLKSHIDNTSFTEWRLPRGLVLKMRAFNPIIQHITKEHGRPGLERIVRLISRADIPLDDRAGELLIGAVLTVTNDVKQSVVYLRNLRQSFPGLRVTIGTLDNMISTAMKRYKLLAHHADRSQIYRDTSTPEAGIHLANSFRWAVQPVVQSLAARQVQPTARTLAHRLKVDAVAEISQGGLPSAARIWDAVLDRGYQPTAHHILALMDGYAGVGAVQDAENVLVLARKHGIRPTTSMWHVLLKGWSHRGQLQSALRAYKAICKLNGDRIASEQDSQVMAVPTPDLVSMSAMTRAFRLCGDYQSAADMALAMERRFGVGYVTEGLGSKQEWDTTATLTAVEALRYNNQHLEALQLIQRHASALTPRLRRVVRYIKSWVLKRTDPKAAPPPPPPETRAARKAKLRQSRVYGPEPRPEDWSDEPVESVHAYEDEHDSDSDLDFELARRDLTSAAAAAPAMSLTQAYASGFDGTSPDALAPPRMYSWAEREALLKLVHEVLHADDEARPPLARRPPGAATVRKHVERARLPKRRGGAQERAIRARTAEKAEKRAEARGLMDAEEGGGWRDVGWDEADEGRKEA